MNRRVWGLVAVALLVSGCLPTYRQAGTVVGLTAPALFVSGMACAGLLWLLWRFATGHRGRFQHGASAAFLCGLALLSIAVLPLWWVDDQGVQRWLDEAFMYFGSSYLALLLVTWRIWVSLDADRSFSWVPIASLVVLLLPALAVLPFANQKLSTDDPFFLLWCCPGTWSFLRKIFVGRAGWGDWPGSGALVIGLAISAELLVRGFLRRGGAKVKDMLAAEERESRRAP